MTLTFCPESSTAVIDWRFGVNVTSLTSPFFVAWISCEYVIFSLPSRRGMLIVSDVVVEGEFVRITDEEMRAAVDQMTELALHVVTA